MSLRSPHETFLPLPSSWAPVSKLSYKPWLNENDADEVFFSSIHLFAGLISPLLFYFTPFLFHWLLWLEERFYPCSGGGETNNKQSNPKSKSNNISNNSSPHILNIPLTPIGPGPWDLKGRKKMSQKQRNAYCQQASQEMRFVWLFVSRLLVDLTLLWMSSEHLSLNSCCHISIDSIAMFFFFLLVLMLIMMTCIIFSQKMTFIG